MKILLLDNYDSFTYNLLHIVKELGAQIEVRRNDQITLDEVERFDKIRLQDLRVSSVEIAQAGDFLSGELKAAVQAAMHHIETFHAAQRHDTVCIQTLPGVVCWQKSVPVEKRKRAGRDILCVQI